MKEILLIDELKYMKSLNSLSYELITAKISEGYFYISSRVMIML